MEALAAYARAVRLSPTNAAAYANMGHALYNLECYYEALTAYKQAIQLDPSCAEAHYGKGNILRDIACDREAYVAYARAVQLDPLCAPARFWKDQMRLGLRVPEKGWSPTLPEQDPVQPALPTPFQSLISKAHPLISFFSSFARRGST